MALWKDGSAPTVSDLTRYENGIGAVGSAESINLEDKILLARQEIGSALFRFLTDQGSATADVELADVVITEPLQRWATYQSLALTYREAHFSNLSERYKGKWAEYSQQAALAGRELVESGVGRVNSPLPKPAAATVSQAAGTLGPNTYYVAVCWLDILGKESEGSDLVVCVTDAPSTITVLNPAAPSQAAKWNVFAGLTDSDLSRQNLSPLSINVPWTLPGTGLIAGKPSGPGQAPDYYVREQHRIWRG